MKESVGKIGSIGSGTRDERNIGELQWRRLHLKKSHFLCFSSEASQIILQCID